MAIKEVRIRPLKDGTCEVDGSWTDTDNRAQLVLGNVSLATVGQLMWLLEATRRSGEDKIAVIEEHGDRTER